MLNTEAVEQRVRRRAQDARERAEELYRRYLALIDQSEASEEQIEHARRVAIAARGNAAEAENALLGQLERSATIHQLAADAHDQAAAAGGVGNADGLDHEREADRHRTSARRDRAAADHIREGRPGRHRDRA